MGERHFDIQYRFFEVNERPFCLWDTDVKGLTLEFLDSIDPAYFEYIADCHSGAAFEEKSQLASLVIRAVYSQGLETLFALIAAAVQAPRCVPAWIVTYNSADLYSLVERISEHQPVLSLLKEERLSWSKLSRIILSWLELEDKEMETSIKKGFAKLWSRFARDFLDDGFRGEYNSIKHGLRIRPGGFHITIGAEEKPGVAAPQERMHLLGRSDYGSSFLVVEKHAKAGHHIRLKRRRRNWSPEDFGWGLHLISMSISNVISSLKALNGVPPEEVRFQWPTDLGSFSEPWKRSIKIGVTSITGFQTVIPDDLIEPFPRPEILAAYKQGRDAGIRRFTTQNQADDRQGDLDSDVS